MRNLNTIQKFRTTNQWRRIDKLQNIEREIWHKIVNRTGDKKIANILVDNLRMKPNVTWKGYISNRKIAIAESVLNKLNKGSSIKGIAKRIMRNTQDDRNFWDFRTKKINQDIYKYAKKTKFYMEDSKIKYDTY